MKEIDVSLNTDARELTPGKIIEEKPNLVIYMMDALRADHWPDWPGTTVDTIAAGTGTPQCLPSLVTGTAPHKHKNVWFWNSEIQVPSLFDLEQEGYNVGFFDHPADRTFNILRHPPFTPLEDLEPPFVYVERRLETHTPYGVDWRHFDSWDKIGPRPAPREPRKYPEEYTDGMWDNGNDYYRLMQTGEIDWHQDYLDGIDRANQDFISRVNTLIDKGVLDDTFVIYTADHGDAWGGNIGWDNCMHQIHNMVCEHVVNVKTTFYGEHGLDVPEPLGQKDILSVWDERWKDGRDDLEMLDREPNEVKQGERGSAAAEQRLRDLGYIE